jgi:phytoene dehydrogenase-like protein
VGRVRRGEAFWQVLEALGIHEAVEFVELDPEGFDRLVFPDYEFALCKGEERLRSRLIAEFPREVRGIERYFGAMRQVVEAMADAASMMGGPLRLLGFLLKHPSIVRYSRIPYQVLLDEVTSDLRLQAVLAGQSGTYGLPPARASTMIALLVLDHYLGGAYYPRGGSGALRDALVTALHAQGGESATRARVVRIDRQGDSFRLETACGVEHTAASVISDADPAITLGQLADPQLVPARMRQKAVGMRPSMCSFHAFVGTDLDLSESGLRGANVHRYEEWDVNDVYERRDVSTLQERIPFCFMTSPSAKDPKGGHAPQAKHTLELFCGARYGDVQRWAGLKPGERGTEYTALKEEIGRQLIRAAEEVLPGLSEQLDVVECASPLTSEYWVNAAQGAMYGPEMTPDQMGAGRFASSGSGVEGLYFAGAAVLGGGINACLSSGIQAASKALGYLEELGG